MSFSLVSKSMGITCVVVFVKNALFSQIILPLNKLIIISPNSGLVNVIVGKYKLLPISELKPHPNYTD